MINSLFSICVPVYNDEQYIRECIDSVLGQSYHNFELILVDDGSNDSSLNICKEYESKDSRIRVFSKENEGQLATRNYAFSKSIGEVIVCLDSDDYLELDALEKIITYINSYDCDCVYYCWRKVKNGREIEKNSFDDSINLITEKRLLYRKIFTNSDYNSMCIKAFKRSILPTYETKAFFKIRHAEDLIQTVEIIEKAHSVLFVPNILYNYRMNQQSVSHVQKTSLNYESGNAVRLYVYDFLKTHDVFNEDDWLFYGTFCTNLFWNKIFSISNIKESLSNRIHLLDDEWNSRYYTEFLKFYDTKNFLKNFCLKLYMLRMFRIVLFLCCMMKFFLDMKFFFKKSVRI